jgi:hypothetical protein
MSEQPLCQLCGNPMPEGEESFVYHGYSGPCPPKADDAVIDLARRGSEPPQSPANPPLSAPTNTDELVYIVGKTVRKWSTPAAQKNKPYQNRVENEAVADLAHLIVQKQIEELSYVRKLEYTRWLIETESTTVEPMNATQEYLADRIKELEAQLKGDTK